MNVLRDIESTKDIEQLVGNFYSKVLEDETISRFFKDHMTIQLEDHLPVMYNFWTSVILNTANYKGNPIVSHIQLNRKAELKDIHFAKWLELWDQTIDTLFSGKNADTAKQKAKLMATLMKHKIDSSKNDKFIL